MKKFIRTIGVALTLILAISGFAVPCSADEAAMNAMIECGVYAEGRPDDSITRAELCTVIYRMTVAGSMLETETEEAPQEAVKFVDVPEDAWFAPYVEYCSTRGYVKGFGGEFYPTSLVTGTQALVMLLRAAGYFDNFTGPDWEIIAIQAGGMAGVFDNGLSPAQLFDVATRDMVAEISTALFRLAA